jgi:hypothetical protein
MVVGQTWWWDRHGSGNVLGLQRGEDRERNKCNGQMAIQIHTLNI